ncbi:MAG: squalene/phytoene synthase family protein [Ignavibacteria bacterium]|nr:squalene/phytoene synthase family protein [Ignavibacteria bacterium]
MKPDVLQLIESSGGREKVYSVTEAYAWCLNLASTHYENFPVASRFLPARMRLHVTAVYAFARFADDVADEPWTTDPKARLDTLDLIGTALVGTINTHGHPIFMALHATIAQLQLPLSPFQKLISAFKQDVTFTPPNTWDDVMDYCARSANPVGELVLRIADEGSESAIKFSNDICTGLQIINFVQDTSVDLARGRKTYPGDAAAAIEIAKGLFVSGLRVVNSVKNFRLRLELKFIIAGGIRVTELCQELGSKITTQRPAIRRTDYLRILFRVVNGSWRKIS